MGTHYALAAEVLELSDQYRFQSPGGLHVAVTNPTAAALLQQFERARPLQAALRNLPVHLRPQFQRLLDELVSVGLLAPTPQLRCRVGLVGDGLLGRELAAILAAEPSIQLRICAPQLPTRELDPKGRFDTQASAVRALTLRRVPAATTRVHCGVHWSELGTHNVDLVVIAAATIEPDRAVVHHLIAQRVPHLVVRTQRNFAEIGPLCDFQGGACLGCIDLHRTELDPNWPQVWAPLANRMARSDARLRTWAAVQGGLRVAWYATGLGNGLRSLTIAAELNELGERRRQWQPHPACPCQQMPSQPTV